MSSGQQCGSCGSKLGYWALSRRKMTCQNCNAEHDFTLRYWIAFGLTLFAALSLSDAIEDCLATSSFFVSFAATMSVAFPLQLLVWQVVPSLLQIKSDHGGNTWLH